MTKDLVSAIQRIEAQRVEVLEVLLRAEAQARSARDTLAGIDLAIFELNKATPEDALPVKAPRLDIAKAVLEKLSGSHLTASQLGEMIGRKPSLIRSSLDRLIGQGLVVAQQDGRYRLPLAEAAQ